MSVVFLWLLQWNLTFTKRHRLSSSSLQVKFEGVAKVDSAILYDDFSNVDRVFVHTCVPLFSFLPHDAEAFKSSARLHPISFQALRTVASCQISLPPHFQSLSILPLDNKHWIVCSRSSGSRLPTDACARTKSSLTRNYILTVKDTEEHANDNKHVLH